MYITYNKMTVGIKQGTSKEFMWYVYMYHLATYSTLILQELYGVSWYYCCQDECTYISPYGTYLPRHVICNCGYHPFSYIGSL